MSLLRRISSSFLSLILICIVVHNAIPHAHSGHSHLGEVINDHHHRNDHHSHHHHQIPEGEDEDDEKDLIDFFFTNHMYLPAADNFVQVNLHVLLKEQIKDSHSDDFLVAANRLQIKHSYLLHRYNLFRSGPVKHYYPRSNSLRAPPYLG